MAPVKERVAKFREKLKNDKPLYETYLLKERERDKQRRSEGKLRMSGNSVVAQNLLKIKREKKRIEMQKWRQAQRNKPPTTAPVPDIFVTPSYKCPQTLGKAKSRVRKALPMSPRKRLQVTTEILIEEMPSAAAILFKKARVARISRQIDETTRHKVEEFYELDSISRQEPGKRDVVSVKDAVSHKRNLIQKRIMLITVREAFALFTAENSNVPIKLSKFFEFRPKHVLPMSNNMPHNVCVCKHHANMEFLIQSIHDVVPAFPTTGRELVEALVCNADSEECMTSICENCHDNGHCIRSMVGDISNMTRTGKWKMWSDVDGRPQVITKSGTIAQALDDLQKKIGSYKMHVFIKRRQSASFEHQKASMGPEEGILQMDFAENFATVFQDEIQSAHWSHGQVTIFTAVAWLGGTKRCFGIISDDLLHGKLSVYVFMKKIVQELKAEFPLIQKLKVFTDGCAAQFKNKYTLSNIVYMKEDFGVTVEWSFFASSHGKGAVDGVGGLLKRLVWLKVKARQAVVNTAEEFAAVAQSVVTNVHILFVTAIEVAAYSDILECRWENVNAIPRLQSMHHMTVGETPGTILVGLTNESVMRTVLVHPQVGISDSDEESPCTSPNASIVTNQNDSAIQSVSVIEVGSFVQVSLPVAGKSRVARQYFAEVMDMDIDNDSIVLNYMTASGKNYWVWPETREESCEKISSIGLRYVKPPQVVNNRGQFQFI